MDYEIDLNTLNSKKTNLSTLKKDSEDAYSEFNSNFSGLSGTELGAMYTSLEASVQRLKTGGANSNTWYEGYITAITNLEDELAAMDSANLAEINEFKGKFEDMFGRVTMPVLKTGGDIHALAKTGKYVSNEATVFTLDIPDDVNQAGYTVTCYGPGGWYLGGGSSPTAVASGTNQKLVHNAWLNDGGRYKDGIAVINLNGVDHYLIATASSLGKVGDSITVNFKNGQSIPCIIADAKSSNDSNYTKYGHGRSDGSVNVLEFEVDRNKYNSSGNPSTDRWGLEWDSSSDVDTVNNHGSFV